MTKILVIEDDEELQGIINEMLLAEDFDSISAENGQIGVQLAKEELPDLILCDVMMPELDGYAVLSQLRQDSETNAIPFIFLTAKTAKADWRYGMELGADDYLTKPFTRDELLGAITTRLKKYFSITQHYTIALEHATEQFNQIVNYDSVTKLPNQRLLGEQFNQTFARILNEKKLIPILSLGVDRSNQLNHILGHVSSESLLNSLAQRLIQCVSSHDIVARLNTGDFAIILTTLNEKEEILHFTQSLLDTLSQPLIVDDQPVFITVSIGIAFYPSEGSDIDTLIKKARVSMYEAYRQGGNRYQIYTIALETQSDKQQKLKAGLYQALERAELQVYYQPKVEIQTRKIVGAEALLRWQHPEFGFISPAEFIPLAEETGWIIPIGEWVLRTACIQTQKWHAAGFTDLHIAVNLSGCQFQQKDFHKTIENILQEIGFNPKYLELEITESILVQDVESALKLLQELRKLNLKISIDDFGTGYSSLSYLKQFPFDHLKIDRCFVRNLSIDSQNAAITAAIIQMAHSLNLKVIAEGVETEAEFAFLSQHQCEEIQGYLFSPPLPASEFEKLITRNNLTRLS